MLIQPNTQPHRGDIIQLILMQLLILLRILLLHIQLRPFLFHFFFLLGTLITAHMNVDFIRHNPIVAELNGLVEAETISDVLWFLQFELHDDLIEMQDV